MQLQKPDLRSIRKTIPSIPACASGLQARGWSQPQLEPTSSFLRDAPQHRASSHALESQHRVETVLLNRNMPTSLNDEATGCEQGTEIIDNLLNQDILTARGKPDFLTIRKLDGQPSHFSLS